jgi:hypothetical protein
MGYQSGSEYGRSLSVHRGTFGAGGWLWYIGGILIASAVAQLAKLGSAADAGEGLAMAGGAAVLGLLLLMVPIMRWRQRVEVFEHGLVWERLLGRVAVARAEVQKVGVTRHHSRMGTHSEVSIDLADGRQLSIVGVDGAEQLGNMLAAFAAAPAVVPAAAVGGYAAGGWRPPN